VVFTRVPFPLIQFCNPRWTQYVSSHVLQIGGSFFFLLANFALLFVRAFMSSVAVLRSLIMVCSAAPLWRPWSRLFENARGL